MGQTQMGLRKAPSSQDYINSPKIDTLITNEAPLKKMICPLDVTVQIFDKIQTELHLQKLLFPRINLMKLIKMKNSFVVVNETNYITLSETSQTHTDIWQVPEN